MNNFFEIITSKILENKKKVIAGTILFFVIIITAFSFDKALAGALIFTSLFTAILFYVLYRLGVRDKRAYWLFLGIFIIHALAVIFIYYGHFQPAAGGADYEGYNRDAIEVAHRFRQFNFSLDGIYTKHYYPVMIGIIYTVTVPAMIMGQLFSAWLAALSVLLCYFLVIEIGGSERSGFVAGFVVGLYPSFLYFGDLLLKDTLVIPLIILGILVAIKTIKSFSVPKFLLFFFVLVALINLRFYVGFALLFSFIVCWFILSNLVWRERLMYGLVIVALLGMSPQVAGFQDYYGADLFGQYLNKNVVKKYREVIYAPSVQGEVAEVKTGGPGGLGDEGNAGSGSSAGSSFVVPSGVDNPFDFIKNSATSFTYSALGPFPWQLRYKRHLFFLADTIPFYILSLAFLYSIIKMIRKNGFSAFLAKYKFCLPLILFAILAFGALSLLINNFGIITRIRMPMYIVLASMMFLGFEDYINKVRKIYAEHIINRSVGMIKRVFSFLPRS